MVAFNRQQILNCSRFTRDIKPLLKENRDIIIEVPAKKDVSKKITTNDFDVLMKEIFRLSKNLPHSKIALTYTLDKDSSILLEIQPITDAA